MSIDTPGFIQQADRARVHEGRPINIVFEGKSDMGRVRKNNEDSFMVDPEANLAIVADGMGGLDGGEIASQMALDIVSEQIYDVMPTDEIPADDVDAAENAAMIYCMEKFIPLFKIWINKANEEVVAFGNNQRQGRKIGTTILVFFARGDRGLLAHVGDSRIYMLRDNQLIQVTKDHSVLNKMLEQGLQLTEEQKKKYKHVITQAIGVAEEIQPEVRLHKLEPGDIYLMCTDGLTDMVGDNEIRDMMINNSRRLPKLAEKLIELANARGGKDNITVVLARVDGS